MTSLFSSKWLAMACALALALIQTSYALQCHFDWGCDTAPSCIHICPEANFFHAFGFPRGREVYQSCIIMKDENMVIRFCTPNGKMWAAKVGGQDKCKEVEGSEIKDLFHDDMEMWQDIQQDILHVEGEVNLLNATGQTIPPDLWERYDALKAFDQSQEQGRGRGRSSKSDVDDDDKGDLYVCQADLCNADVFQKTKPEKSGAVSGYRLRNDGAIIVLAAFACLFLSRLLD